MSDVSGLSDSQLDAAYAACYDLADYATASFYESEILNRLQNVWSWGAGLVGYTRFPLYDKTGHFSQTGAAQSSISVGIDTAVGQAKAAGGAVLSAAAPALLVAGLAVGFILYLKFRGK